MEIYIHLIVERAKNRLLMPQWASLAAENSKELVSDVCEEKKSEKKAMKEKGMTFHTDRCVGDA